MAHTDGLFIRHQLNRGEKRVGSRAIPVDGFCKENNTVYQFHGCFWHGHRCHLNPQEFNPVKNLPRAELRRQTEEISAYIRAQGHSLVEMWECEWTRLQQEDANAADFVRSRRLPHQHKMSSNLCAEMAMYAESVSISQRLEDIIKPHLRDQ